MNDIQWTIIDNDKWATILGITGNRKWQTIGNNGQCGITVDGFQTIGNDGQ